jgi:hypothetical protein
MIAKLSNAPGLGLFPEMSVEDDGIYITREDEDCGLLPIYSFHAGHYTREQFEELAGHILKQTLVDDAFLINNGFEREYGARAGMRKMIPISLPAPPAGPPTPPVRQAPALANQAPARRRRVKRATPIRSAVKAIALRLSSLSPRL